MRRFSNSVFNLYIISHSHFNLYSPFKMICFSASSIILLHVPRDNNKARHLRREESTTGVLGTTKRNAVGQSKYQAFVFRGDFSTAAGQFSHFVYGRS